MNAQPITFRPAQLEDLKCLNDVNRKSKGYWGYDEAFMDDFMVHFSVTPEMLKEGTFYVMTQGDNMVGFYGLSSQDEVELLYFLIHPNYIGKGLGRQMWDHMVDTARAQGWDHFIIWADPQADSFYAKMGCQKVGTRQSPLAPNRFPTIFKYNVTS